MTESARAFSRRSFIGVTGTLAVTGCLGNGDDSGGDELASHPAARDTDGVPRLGPDPTDAEAVVVEFGDPSCVQCAHYAEQTLPTLRTEYVDTGRMAYLWRGRPTVEEWARSAIATLHATHAQDPATFWWLKDRYYSERRSITTNNVVDRAIEWLAERDAVDGPRVKTAVRDGRYADRIEADRTAAAESEVTGVPTFALFRDGRYRTTVVGPQPPAVFEGALDL